MCDNNNDQVVDFNGNFLEMDVSQVHLMQHNQWPGVNNLPNVPNSVVEGSFMSHRVEWKQEMDLGVDFIDIGNGNDALPLPLSLGAAKKHKSKVFVPAKSKKQDHK